MPKVCDAQGKAFNITRIARRFYDEYKTHYNRARELVRHYNRGIAEFQNADQEDKLHAFTQRLLRRLMFLYFLQSKGWFGGRQRFLTEQYLDTVRRHAGEFGAGQETFYYYREVLEPLFFETMNTRRPDNVTRWPGVRIPYLNSGLFDKSRDPEGVIVLPDSLFNPNSRDGLLAFFNRYNFTIADDTPLEQDAAVDPEMLGKVFENMLEERDRGQTGSFYTPRTIVSYMCQEALAGYLEESAQIPRETTRALFDPDSNQALTPDEAGRISAALDTLTVLDPAVGSGSFLIGMLGEIILLRRACASALGVAVTPALMADWKEAIIRDTLYGVDIKPEAIEIAQLRLWLALVVDQTIEQARPLPNLDYKLMAGNSLIETIDGEPVLTDSATAMLDASAQDEWEYTDAQLKLFNPNPMQMRMVLFESEKQTQQKRIRLDELRQQFFRASPEERRQLRDEITRQERRIVFSSLKEKAEALQEQIDHLGKKARLAGGRLGRADQRKLQEASARLARITDLQERLRKPDAALPFFLYRLHFSEVFAAKGGFDIVIANPPYVRQQLISDQKPELQASYPDVYAGTADLYVYFFVRAFDLLRTNGQLSFITSNKFMRANYGKRLRKYLAKHKRLHTLLDFGDLPVFGAAAYPMITLASNEPPDDNKIRVLEIASLDETESLHQAADRAFCLPQNTLSEESWQLSAPKVRALMDKLKAAGKPLGEYVNGAIYCGIKTGLNKAFIINEAKRAELIAADPRSAELIKPCLRGRDINRWESNWAGLYIIFARRGTDIDEYPAVKAHLMQWKEDLKPKKTPQDKQGRLGPYKWYEIQDNIACYLEFEKPKIVYPDIAAGCEFTMDTNRYYLDGTLFLIPTEDYFLLGVLNSKPCRYFMNGISSTIRGGFIRFKKICLSQLPIPDVPDTLRQQIARVAQQCLDAAKYDPGALPALETELNALVYQAYGLDADDIRVIEENCGRSGSPHPAGGRSGRATERHAPRRSSCPLAGCAQR